MHLCPYTMQFSVYNKIIALYRRRCLLLSLWPVLLLSFIKKNLYLTQFFSLSVPLSIAVHFFTACVFLFSFFQQTLLIFFFFFIFPGLFLNVCLHSVSSLLFFFCCLPCFLVCLHPKTMFVRKTYTVFGMKACFRNHVESILFSPFTRIIVAISIFVC